MNGFGFSSPLATPWTVPSPPRATTIGHFSAPASAARSTSWPAALVDPEVDIEPRAPGGGDDTLFQPGRSPPPGGRIQDHDGITHCGFPVRERVGVEPTEAAEGAFQRF